MKISAVIITYNEEHNISRCLESLQKVADEVIVVDSYSSDRTEEICRSFELRFIQHAFEGHIEQKNFAMQLAANDFVLSLDADEALSEALRESLLRVKQEQENKHEDAYTMNRLTCYCGKWIRYSGWYPDTKVRLWNKHKGRWGGINPHDKVVLQQGAGSRHLKGDLLHYSFNTIEEHVNQINAFTSISANALITKNGAVVFVKMLFSPCIRFLRDYFFKQGFRDGLYGFIICKNTAYSRFLRYAKLYQLIVKPADKLICEKKAGKNNKRENIH
ncbi:MAG: glycosyltransferase family 2 protein [Bacteroidales bacterium]